MYNPSRIMNSKEEEVKQQLKGKVGSERWFYLFDERYLGMLDIKWNNLRERKKSEIHKREINRWEGMRFRVWNKDFIRQVQGHRITKHESLFLKWLKESRLNEKDMKIRQS